MVDVPALLSIRLSRKYQLKKRKRNESAQWSANVDVSLSGDVSLTDSCKRKSSDMNDLANRKTIKIHRGENGNERGAPQHGLDGLPITFREGEEDNDDGDEDDNEDNDSEDERLDDSAIFKKSDSSKNISKASNSTTADGHITFNVSDNRKDEDDIEGDDNNDNEDIDEDYGVINSSIPSVELAVPHGGLEWNQNPDSRRNMDKVEVTTGLTYSFIAMITMMVSTVE